MKKYKVTLKPEIIDGPIISPLLIEAQNMNEALDKAAKEAIKEYNLVGWEKMTICIKVQPE